MLYNIQWGSLLHALKNIEDPVFILAWNKFVWCQEVLCEVPLQYAGACV